MESILTSVKKLLGIAEECTDFDVDIIIHINTVFMELTQMGVGPESGYRIEDDTNTWDEFTNDDIALEAVKSYVPLKVKALFDPTASSAVSESIKREIDRLEWRLYIAADSK